MEASERPTTNQLTNIQGADTHYVAQVVDWTVDSLHCEEQKCFFQKSKVRKQSQHSRMLLTAASRAESESGWLGDEGGGYWGCWELR